MCFVDIGRSCAYKTFKTQTSECKVHIITDVLISACLRVFSSIYHFPIEIWQHVTFMRFNFSTQCCVFHNIGQALRTSVQNTIAGI